MSTDNLTDKSIVHILGHCPDIVSISLGSFEKKGRIKGHFFAFMNMRENQHKWNELESISLINQPLNKAQVRSVTKKRPNLQIDEIQTPSHDVVRSLTDAGIPPVDSAVAEMISEDITTTSCILPVMSRWRGGYVVGPDWAGLVRRELRRLNAIKRLKSQVQQEAEEEAEESESRKKQTLDPESLSLLLPVRKIARYYRDEENADQVEMTNEAAVSVKNHPRNDLSSEIGSEDSASDESDSQKHGSNEHNSEENYQDRD